jgi:hypothetical protein
MARPKTVETNTEISHSYIQKLIEVGIPVAKAQFHQAVMNGMNQPENMLSEKSDNKSRRADMWLTQLGLICKQEDKIFGTPLANIIYFHFKQ